MRKKSVSEIQKVYKISAQDRKSIAETVTATGLKESVTILKDAGKSLETVARSIEAASGSNTGNVEKILNNQFMAIREIIKDIASHKKQWEFDVQRNKSGFISKVFAKQIK